jgi:MOSC domain-containing protein YiiM
VESFEVLHLYVSPKHNYFGHHGGAPDEHPAIEQNEIQCVAGRGIEGDRFYDYKPDYKGQISFFAHEVYQALCVAFGVNGICPGAFRRNVITRGTDLNSLVGKEFSVQGVRFLGTGECKPCYWMDSAFHAGAAARLMGCGGLRAKILSTGRLCTRAKVHDRTPQPVFATAT